LTVDCPQLLFGIAIHNSDRLKLIILFQIEFSTLFETGLIHRLLREVGKRVKGKGERANKNLFPFPPLAKVTFARGLINSRYKYFLITN